MIADDMTLTSLTTMTTSK